MKKAQGHDLYAHYSVAEKQLSSSRMPYIGSYENELCMAKIRKGEQTHETANQEAASCFAHACDADRFASYSGTGGK